MKQRAPQVESRKSKGKSPQLQVKNRNSLPHSLSPVSPRLPSTVYRLLAPLLFVGIAALLTGCTPTSSPPPPPVPRPNVVIAVEGTAQLKRAGWKVYSPVGFGALLQYDDLLDVDGRVQILCGDLTVRTLASGRDSCPCPPWEGAFTTGGAKYRNVPQNVPYIQYPRNTLILDAQPLLRWRDTDASGYTVAVIQAGRTLWEQTGVTDATLRYPADAPLLQPGVDYLLRVQAEDSDVSSDEDPARGIGFRLIAPAQQAALEAHCAPVTALLDLDDAARDYALALCYATWEPEGSERGPWGAAWLLLETVAQTHDAPAVHLWTGDLLSRVTLPAEAEAAYRVALARAEALGDLASQAAAHAGLWRVTGDAGAKDTAIALYKQLGDLETVKDFE